MKTIITLCKGTNILCNSFGVKKILLVVIFFIPIIFNASGQNVQSTSVYPNIARTINKLSFVYSYEDGELKVGWRGLTWGANRSYLTFTKPSLPTGSIIDRIELKLHLKGGSTSSSHVTKICKLNYHSSNSPKDYYDEMNNSTQYASGSWLGIPTSNPVTIDLIPGAVTDYLNSSLNFYIGIKEDGDDDSYGSIYGINEDDFYYPSLLIYYIVPYVNVDKTSLTLGQGINSVNSLQIISNTSWNASVNVPWISINPSSGSNDNTIEIKATSENQSSTPRNAILTITGTNATTKTVSITQEGITLQCSPLSLELESTEGSNKQVNIASNYTWEASSNVMWLFPEPLNSTGNGSITINAAFTNPSIDPRTGLITVKSGDLTKTITVTQKGSAPILTVTPANLTFESPSGSNGDFTITSNTRWTVTDDASWLTLSSASGSGNGTLTVTVSSANTATNTRTANVTFSASSVSPVVVTVTQSGTSSQLVVTPSNQNVSSSSGTTSFAVESNISWTASSNQTWCTITPSGTGNGTIKATYQANTGNAARTATVTVTGTGVSSQTVTVTQSGPSSQLVVTPSNQNVSSSSGTTSFAVESNISWTASSNQTWCTVTPSGTGNGTITATYQANTGTAARTATVTVTGIGVSSQTVTVTQSGTTSTLSVSPTSITVGSASGSTGSISVMSSTSWSVSDDATWLTVSPASGSGNGSVTVSTNSANTSTSTRSATVTFSVSGVSSPTVTVTQSSAPNNKECNNLLLTKGQYTETENLNTRIQSEFGENYSIADWAGLKVISNINEWITCLGLSEDQTFMLTNNGDHFWGDNRHYYVHYSSDGIPYPGFAVHDKIGGLYLGSWYGITMNLLAKNLITSIAETKSLDIKVYPNPANHEVVLESDLIINHVQILNLSGSVLLEKTAKTQQVRIDLSQLSTGNYFIKISTEKGIISKNLIIFR